jgi:CBS domain-containing protein
VSTIADLLLGTGFNSVLVASEGILIGIVSRRELLQLLTPPRRKPD